MKRWRFGKVGRVALLAVFLTMSVPFYATAVVNPDAPPLVMPTYISISNFKLTDPPANCDVEYKFDSGDINNGAPGTYVMTFENVKRCDDPTQFGDVTVTVVISEGNKVAFSIEGGKTGVVYVKGGPGGNLYDYRADYPDGVTEDSNLTTPGSAFGVSHVSFCLCADAGVKKDWEFTAPAGADAGWTYKAYYTEDLTEPVDWTEVALADADMDGVYTATTTHDEDAEIWWKWKVYDGMTLLFESAVFGPETLAAPGPYTNDFTIVLKEWEFTAPDAFADRGYDYKAYYTEDPDAEPVVWVAVDLADPDMDGVWTGRTLFDVDTEIWWKWRVYDGMDVVFESDVFGPEKLAAPGPYANDFCLALKAWMWTPDESMLEFFDEVSVSAFYTLDGENYYEVELVEDEGAFYAETYFECGTAVDYYFVATGVYAGMTIWSFTSPESTEIIEGRATVENVFNEQRTLKSFELTARTEPAGGTYYAAWAPTAAGPWYEIPLVPDPVVPNLYVGDFAPAVLSLTGMEIYWKFYDAEWSTTVFGPETLTGMTMVNEYERNGVTRTIGYWQTHVCMAEHVFNEKLSATIDLGWTTLYSIEEVMAVLNYPQMAGAPRLSSFNKAKLQTSRQLTAAILNEGLGTSVPMIDWYGTDMSIIEAARLALASGNLADIKMIGEILDEFNNSGTEEWLPDWKPDCWNKANPQLAVYLGSIGWPAVRGAL